MKIQAAAQQPKSIRPGHEVEMTASSKHRRWVAQLKRDTLRVGTHLGGNNWLSQYGKRGSFRERPRFEDLPQFTKRPEFDVSAVLGRKTVEQTVRHAFQRPYRDGDEARYFICDELTMAGYVPTATPSERNDLHVSVYGGVDHHVDPVAAKDWWLQPSRVTLEEIARRSEALGGEHGALD